MREVSFHCPFAAQGKARARAGNGRHYTPQKTVDFQNAVEAAAFSRATWIGATQFTGPVELEVECIFAPAKSWSKKRRAAAMGRPHTSKPDFDNIGKAVADALNGVLFRDDAQVFSAVIRKTWGETDGFRVTVREIPA